MAEVLGDVTELLRQLIRNACVNDGTPGSGFELASAETLEAYLAGPGIELETYQPLPGRASLVGRIEGSDPAAPSLMLMGHTDVVPVTPDNWLRDPFGGELVDGEVWGRGAIDMLSLTASMAVAVRRLADGGFRPKGTLTYLAVADEEAGGRFGARWLAAHQLEAVRCDYCLTESGGFSLPVESAGGPMLPVTVAEKGIYWCTLRTRGRPAHASRPLHSDNALVKAAEVVRRLSEYRPRTQVPQVWRRFVEGMGMPAEDEEMLLTPGGINETCHAHHDPGWARLVHASTHTTVAPTVMRAGLKGNVIPDRAELQVDIRTLPGQTEAHVQAMLADALGDFFDSVEVVIDSHDPATASPFDGPLWDVLRATTSKLVPGAGIVPFMSTGATDARFFRSLGATAYGFALFSDRFGFADYSAMVHGDNERVDLRSLDLCSQLWPAVAHDLLNASA